MFQITLAHSVALNAHAQFDDTKITTVETVTSTASLSYVAHFHDNTDNGENDDDDNDANASSSSSSGGSDKDSGTTASTQHDLTVNVKVTTTKGPLVVGNRQQFQDISKDLKSARTIITNAAAPTKSTIDHAIKSNQIPFVQENVTSTKTARNVSSKFEMVISALAKSTSNSNNNSIHSNSNSNRSNVQVEKPIPDTKSSLLSSPSKSMQSNNRANQEINSQQSHSTNAQNSTLMDNSNNNNSNSNNQIIDDNDHIKLLDYVNGESNGDKNDYANSDIQLPQSDAPASTATDTTGSDHVSEKVRPDAVYFVVAVIGGAKIWARTLAQMLDEMGPPFSGDSLGSPLRPIYVDLPTNGR